MSYQLQEINRRIDQDVKGFLEECDAQYAQKVSQAADAILTNLPHSPIVLLSGPSGSGKTTTALKIEEELEKRGVLSHTISMDNYFKTLDPKTAPRTADGLVDFESPKCMDMDLLNSHFAKLSKGETIVVPKFEFARQMRNDSRGTPLRLGKDEIAIFEGIHALNDDIAGRHPEATGMYISARSNILEGEELRFKGTWMRISRRAVREGQRALIVDDFMRAGGTARGMVDMMREFSVTVVGVCVLISTKEPVKKRLDGVKSLLVIDETDESAGSANIHPANWLIQAAGKA